MKIGIIGAGNIGGTLGQKWAAAGYSVWFGVRQPGDPKYDALRGRATVTGLAQAVEAGEVLVLAQPGSAVAEFATAYGAALAGKVVVDTTNNIRSSEMNNLAILQAAAPQARLARAFNALGWMNFVNPQINGQQIDLFYCSQPEARNVAEPLIAAVGLRPVFLGGLDQAAALDGLTRAWLALAFGQNRGGRIAFKLLTED